MVQEPLIKALQSLEQCRKAQKSSKVASNPKMTFAFFAFFWNHLSMLTPLRALPKAHSFSPEDAVVIFGEVFDKGYVNGVIKEAERGGSLIVYSTVGRRTKEGELRPLTKEEILSPYFINIPLEAGFESYTQ